MLPIVKNSYLSHPRVNMVLWMQLFVDFATSIVRQNWRTSWPVGSPIFGEVCSPKELFSGFSFSSYVLSCDEIASPAQMKHTFPLR